MQNANIDSFNSDVARNEGYLYTTKANLSSRLANRRLSDLTLELADFHGKNVLDIGCGDGTYTIELYDRGKPATMHGVDAASLAIESASKKAGYRRISFSVGSAYQLPWGDNAFDIAYLRGVLHHLNQPVVALRESLRVAREIVVIEPNGLSPILKILEKLSRYHREHDEKSFSAFRLRRWIADVDGSLTRARWAGLVPYFCPGFLARILKIIEPIVEATPVLNAIGCAVFAFTAQRTEATKRARKK